MELKAFTILLRFLSLHIQSNLGTFNLKNVNLKNSRIESIEHITMNPTDKEYMDYYGDYIDHDFKDDDYDHVGDINDFQIEKFVFPTIGKEDLNLSIGPMALSVAEVGDFTKEYGTYIGDLKAHSHGIRGHVYIVDKNHLYIRKFSYDGGGSLDAYFWVGSDKQPSPKGQVVPYPPHDGFDRKTNRPLAITQTKGENILLPLPQGRFQGTPMDISEIKWLSIWCTRFTVNFAEIFVPNDPKVPRRLFLEKFPKVYQTNLYELRSDAVQILDEKTFYIPNFYLFVEGEKGYRFQASSRNAPDKFTIDIPNENNRYDDLVDYNGRDIIIALPFKTTVYDILFFAIVDTINDRVVGKVKVPSPPELESHPVPPSRGQNQQWWPEQTPPTGTPRNQRPSYTPPGSSWKPTEAPQPVKIYELPNCREFLGRKVRVFWKSDREQVYFRVQAKTREDEYAALGVVPPGGAMSTGIEADFVKLFINNTKNGFANFLAVDSFLSDEKHCSLRDGLCSDVDHRRSDNVILVDFNRQADVSTVDFIKPRMALDELDADISDRVDTMVLVAIGSLSMPIRRVSGFEMENSFDMENGTIDFNSKEAQKCFKAPPPDPDTQFKWRVPFKIRSKIHNFEVRLGPPGGTKGYKAITGQDPPFIELCWWINNKLLPELTVYRGETYYFKVQGGDSEKLGSVNYHPFYITSDRMGGYGRKLESERDTERIWAGVENAYAMNYDAKPTAKGSLCYYKSREGEDKWRESETFKEYFTSLEVVCERGSKDNYGLLNWTVAEETDDIVYYQSYTHEGLGWKIRVLSPGESSSLSSLQMGLTLVYLLIIKIVVTAVLNFL